MDHLWNTPDGLRRLSVLLETAAIILAVFSASLLFVKLWIVDSRREALLAAETITKEKELQEMRESLKESQKVLDQMDEELKVLHIPHLTTKQKGDLIDFLKTYAGKRAILMKLPLERPVLAQQIADSFFEAGWAIKIATLYPLQNPPPSSISITAPKSEEQVARKLEEKFRSLSFQVLEIESRVEPEFITVHVFM
jgi:hypothetical protein